MVYGIISHFAYNLRLPIEPSSILVIGDPPNSALSYQPPKVYPNRLTSGNSISGFVILYSLSYHINLVKSTVFSILFENISICAEIISQKNKLFVFCFQTIMILNIPFLNYQGFI